MYVMITGLSSLSVTLVAVSMQPALAADRVKIANGTLQSNAAAKDGVRSFKGIPFAQPPVGDLRWREPQPAANWTGVRDGSEFGSRCMQTQVYKDMIFRDKGISEDCLYLNVWTPKNASRGKLGVMLWFYGGGFAAGSSDEFRYDGEELAKKGIIVVECNYRLGIFGFFSHPELTKESAHHASGNYGLLDQLAIWLAGTGGPVLVASRR